MERICLAEKVHLLVRTVDISFFTRHIYCSNTVTYVEWEGSVLHYIQVDFLRVEVIGKLPKFFHGAAENSERKKWKRNYYNQRCVARGTISVPSFNGLSGKFTKISLFTYLI